ncbi:hypothetical protein GNI_085610 [Gregarina niphandrodes]|uniref:Uncharacterized protein n=1 Tax=Gregarina niphandrodes TaxID=110365 RepID=A0A023B5Z8_GRENI|nr:hypothetical protein GNI_085610 [Gregarina niphandrodes]EZG64349.1 hypothetical protein GNI_085610 [Gregarina niphandrodes]|eukprot:XP_011130638.1 hypothetical protein GNI_085610 [Gregarina niphandrodes]
MRSSVATAAGIAGDPRLLSLIYAATGEQVFAPDNSLAPNGNVQSNSGGDAGMTKNGGTPTSDMYNGGMNNGGMYSGGVYSAGMPNGGMYNGGMYNGGMYNGGIYNGGMYNGGMYNGSMYNGGMYNGGMYNGGMYNGGMYDGGMYNGGMYNGGMYNGGNCTTPTFPGPAASPEEAVLRGHECAAAPYMQRWKDLVDKHLELSTQYQVTNAEMCRQDQTYRTLLAAIECDNAGANGQERDANAQLSAEELVSTLETLEQLREKAEALCSEVKKKEEEIAACVNQLITARATFRSILASQPWLWNPAASGPPQTMFAQPLFAQPPAFPFAPGPCASFVPQTIYQYSSPYLPYPPTMPFGEEEDDDDLADEDLDGQ